jgi:hypothetical protein
MGKPAKRITIKNGKQTKHVVLIAPPFPDVGDVLTDGPTEWTVTKIQNTEILAQFSTRGKRLRQIFP